MTFTLQLHLGQGDRKLLRQEGREASDAHLEVTLGGEGLLAHIALEGLISCMSSHMNLQSGTGAEIATTDMTKVLVVYRRIETGTGRSSGHQSLLEV